MQCIQHISLVVARIPASPREPVSFILPHYHISQSYSNNLTSPLEQDETQTTNSRLAQCMHCLDSKRSSGRKSSLSTARGRIVFIVSCMTSHLSYSATRTPKGATQVFVSMASFFWNGITSSNVLTSPTQGIEGP